MTQAQFKQSLSREQFSFNQSHNDSRNGVNNQGSVSPPNDVRVNPKLNFTKNSSVNIINQQLNRDSSKGEKILRGTADSNEHLNRIKI